MALQADSRSVLPPALLQADLPHTGQAKPESVHAQFEAARRGNEQDPTPGQYPPDREPVTA